MGTAVHSVLVRELTGGEKRFAGHPARGLTTPTPTPTTWERRRAIPHRRTAPLVTLAPDARVVVVGAGLAGLRVVERLRRLGFTGPLALIGEEDEHPYDRPPLSKEVLRGVQEAPAHLRPAHEYAELDLELRLGRQAVAVDVDARTVAFDDGAQLPYDALVLAPGANPRTLPSAPRAGVHMLRTHTDALALRADVTREQALVVVGGGFLGCEAAASARQLGAEVDLVEALPGPLVRVVSPAVAERVAALHEAQGVRLHTGVGVASVGVDVIALADGRSLPAPVVLVALGVVPATGWLAGLELQPDGAVRCDRYGRASAPGVWALGDAAAWEDATGRHRRVEHWSSAIEQAATVSANLLAEEPVPHVSVPYFWSDQYASNVQGLGEVAPDTQTDVLEAGDGLVVLHGDGDRLLGVVTLDANRHLGRARKLLRNGASRAEAREVLSR